jgi:hypothetical protein
LNLAANQPESRVVFSSTAAMTTLPHNEKQTQTVTPTTTLCCYYLFIMKEFNKVLFLILYVFFAVFVK